MIGLKAELEYPSQVSTYNVEFFLKKILIVNILVIWKKLLLDQTMSFKLKINLMRSFFTLKVIGVTQSLHIP